MTTGSSNASSSAVLRNAIAQYGSFAVNVIVGLVLTPVLLEQLGSTSFGAWTAVVALAGYVGLAELGLGTATVRRVAAEFARDDEAAVGRVASTSLAIYLAAAAASVVIVVGLVSLTGQLLDVDSELLGQARVAVGLLAASASANFLLTVYPAIVFGAGRLDLLTRIGVVMVVVSGAAQVTTVLVTADLRALAAVTVTCTLVGALLIRGLARRRYSTVVVRLRHADPRIARQLLGSGWRNAVIGIAALASFNSDVLVVSAFLSASAAAAYGVAVKAANLLHSLTFRISDVLVPTFSHHDAGGDDERIYSLYRETTVLAYAFAIPGCIVLVVFGEPLLQIWLGAVPPGAEQVLAILATSIVVAVPGGIAFSLLSGIDRLRLFVWVALASALANVGIGVVLTPLVGLVGPACATLALRILVDLVVLPIYVCRLLHRSAARWWGQVIRVVGPGSVVALGVALLLRSAGPEHPVAEVGACFATGLAFVAVCVASLGRERRASYLVLLRGRSPSG